MYINILHTEHIIGKIFLFMTYSHFSCVRARDLQFYDFLNNVKANIVK